MEAMGKVKELFPNLSEISSEEIAALFERIDERTRDDEDLDDLDETQSKEGSLAFTRRLVKTVVGRAEDDLSRRITHLHDKVAGLDAKMDAVLAALGKSTSPVVPARDLEPDDAEAHASLAKIAKKSRGGKS